MEADGSTANTNTYQYEMTEGRGTLNIPVQISNSGTVFMEVSASYYGKRRHKSDSFCYSESISEKCYTGRWNIKEREKDVLSND